jgi:hypothetical protein
VSFDAGGASAMLQGWAPGKFAIQQGLSLAAGTFEVSAMVAACVKPPHLSFLMPKVAVVLGHGAALLESFIGRVLDSPVCQCLVFYPKRKPTKKEERGSN